MQPIARVSAAAARAEYRAGIDLVSGGLDERMTRRERAPCRDANDDVRLWSLPTARAFIDGAAIRLRRSSNHRAHALSSSSHGHRARGGTGLVAKPAGRRD